MMVYNPATSPDTVIPYTRADPPRWSSHPILFVDNPRTYPPQTAVSCGLARVGGVEVPSCWSRWWHWANDKTSDHRTSATGTTPIPLSRSAITIFSCFASTAWNTPVTPP